MIIKTNILGYTKDSLRSQLPEYSGIYFVYIASYDKEYDIFKIERLIYIGESDNVKLRVLSHEKYYEWLSYLDEEELCYATCEVEAKHRHCVEAAYIIKHKPPINIEYVHHFPFESITVVSEGEVGLIRRHFSV